MARTPKRRIKARGAGQQPAPVSSSGTTGGGIKKRTTLPPPEPEIPSFGGELGIVVRKLTESGNYGTPFKRASSPTMRRSKSRTGILSLDLCLGGGWTLGSAGMLYGERSSGKSTMALQSIAAIHRRDDQAMCGWIDVEGTLDMPWAEKIGVDLDRLVVAEPETGEHAVDIADALLRSREITMAVTDSIAMLVPMRELDDSAEQDHMALQARLVGKYIRKTNNALLKERSNRNHTPVLLHINQFRMKVGLVFGDPRTLPGGKALEFSTTQQVEAKNKENIGKDEEGNEVVLFNEHNFKITKNKGGGPMKEGAFKLIRTEGQEGLHEAMVSQAKTVFKYGTQVGVVTGSPNSFEIDGINGKFRGAPALNEFALENPAAFDEVQQKIIDGFRTKWRL